jgi:hypothetical protein
MNMKVNTVEQFKVLEFIKENFEIEYIKLELIDRNSIKVIDAKGESCIFYLENNEIKWT